MNIRRDSAQPSQLASPREVRPQTAGWVKDEEVNECPICTRRFSMSVRKHHCRQCGRVVCSSCSDNQIYFQSFGSKQRICDPCFEVQRHEQTASLSENLSHNRQAEVVLKANLKEKHEHAEWFCGFLQRIASESPEVTPSGNPFEEDVESVSRNPLEEDFASDAAAAASQSGDDDSPSRAALVVVRAKAWRRWSQVCADVRVGEAEVDRLLQECQGLEDSGRDAAAEVQRLEEAVRSKQFRLKDSGQFLAEKEQLSRTTSTLRQELQGLQQRAQALQTDHPPGSGFGVSAMRGAHQAPVSWEASWAKIPGTQAAWTAAARARGAR
eukprot:CAMPEP_0115661568 /NCGR_PEP_ID=MMETSP0272-20121206/46857_1 /TAXON_ID=71861 /ORGANISM="Scrippsiella trochoidea, Strain CCMP3099" /LENGTH=324 /DNA_ID=CAMNT_0003099819 /DNA_START=71 /DNA_END=1043 /DNA_ORIENTATION=-